MQGGSAVVESYIAGDILIGSPATDSPSLRFRKREVGMLRIIARVLAVAAAFALAAPTLAGAKTINKGNRRAAAPNPRQGLPDLPAEQDRPIARSRDRGPRLLDRARVSPVRIPAPAREGRSPGAAARSIGSTLRRSFIRTVGLTGVGPSARRCRRCSWRRPITIPTGPLSDCRRRTRASSGYDTDPTCCWSMYRPARSSM